MCLIKPTKASPGSPKRAFRWKLLVRTPDGKLISPVGKTVWNFNWKVASDLSLGNPVLKKASKHDVGFHVFRTREQARTYLANVNTNGYGGILTVQKVEVINHTSEGFSEYGPIFSVDEMPTEVWKSARLAK